MQTQLFEHTVTTSAKNANHAAMVRYELGKKLDALVEAANRPEFDGMVPGSLSITDKIDGFAYVLTVTCDLMKKES